MAESSPIGPKVHPATRVVEPEDPMNLHGVEVPGDTELMLRVLVEEFARMGWDADSLMQLARDPNYSALYGLLRTYGEERLRSRITEILNRCGVIRTTTEDAPAEEDLVQLDFN